MKKKVLLLIMILTGLFIITGCSTKTKLEPNDFVDLIEKNNYKTTNVIDQFSTYPQIKNAFIAQNSDMTYQLEYYEFDNEENAKKFYDGNKKIFENQKPNKTKNIDLNNYQRYAQTTDTIYSIISRIDNTVIYANVKIEYKDEVKKIYEELGY